MGEEEFRKWEQRAIRAKFGLPSKFVSTSKEVEERGLERERRRLEEATGYTIARGKSGEVRAVRYALVSGGEIFIPRAGDVQKQIEWYRKKHPEAELIEIPSGGLHRAYIPDEDKFVVGSEAKVSKAIREFEAREVSRTKAEQDRKGMSKEEFKQLIKDAPPSMRAKLLKQFEEVKERGGVISITEIKGLKGEKSKEKGKREPIVKMGFVGVPDFGEGITTEEFKELINIRLPQSWGKSAGERAVEEIKALSEFEKMVEERIEGKHTFQALKETVKEGTLSHEAFNILHGVKREPKILSYPEILSQQTRKTEIKIGKPSKIEGGFDIVSARKEVIKEITPVKYPEPIEKAEELFRERFIERLPMEDVGKGVAETLTLGFVDFPKFVATGVTKPSAVEFGIEHGFRTKPWRTFGQLLPIVMPFAFKGVRGARTFFTEPKHISITKIGGKVYIGGAKGIGFGDIKQMGFRTIEGIGYAKGREGGGLVTTQEYIGYGVRLPEFERIDIFRTRLPTWLGGKKLISQTRVGKGEITQELILKTWREKKKISRTTKVIEGKEFFGEGREPFTIPPELRTLYVGDTFVRVEGVFEPTERVVGRVTGSAKPFEVKAEEMKIPKIEESGKEQKAITRVKEKEVKHTTEYYPQSRIFEVEETISRVSRELFGTRQRGRGGLFFTPALSLSPFTFGSITSQSFIGEFGISKIRVKPRIKSSKTIKTPIEFLPTLTEPAKATREQVPFQLGEMEMLKTGVQLKTSVISSMDFAPTPEFMPRMPMIGVPPIFGGRQRRGRTGRKYTKKVKKRREIGLLAGYVNINVTEWFTGKKAKHLMVKEKMLPYWIMSLETFGMVGVPTYQQVKAKSRRKVRSRKKSKRGGSNEIFGEIEVKIW
jgi:hypothetical protein